MTSATGQVLEFLHDRILSCIFRQIWRGVCGERPELALFVHFQANLERSLRGKRKLSKTRRTARGLERKGTKRQNIADLAGYKEIGGEMVRKVKF